MVKKVKQKKSIKELGPTSYSRYLSVATVHFIPAHIVIDVFLRSASVFAHQLLPFSVLFFCSCAILASLVPSPSSSFFLQAAPRDDDCARALPPFFFFFF